MSAPCIVEQIFRRGIEISRHHFKGVYLCTIGKNRHQSSSQPAEVLCTLYEGDNFEEHGESDPNDLSTKYGPLTFLYEGHCATLRPWNPRECVIAAGIRNLLVHFPIRPGSRIFALDCPLMTLSHIADTIGSTGHLVGVIDPSSPDRPSQEELSRFLRRHSCAQVILEDVKNATLQRYEQRLSCSEACRFAFLMALHPRLGASSPARLLAISADSVQQVVSRIFGFLQCNDVANTKCLVTCHCPPETHADAIREVVLMHIDIIHQWRTVDFGEFSDSAAKRANSGQEDSGNPDDDDAPEQHADSATQAESAPHTAERRQAKKHSKTDPEHGPRWVLMGLATDHIVVDNGEPENNTMKTSESVSSSPKLSAIVDTMKRLKSGLRTGLLAKEQLLLTPYFANHFLLLLRYAARRDERGSRSAKKMPVPPGLEIDGDMSQRGAPANGASSHPAPSSTSLPMPLFGGSFGGKKPPASAPPEPQGALAPPLALPPGLSRPEPARVEFMAGGNSPATTSSPSNASYGLGHRGIPSPLQGQEMFDPEMLLARGGREANLQLLQMLQNRLGNRIDDFRGVDVASHVASLMGPAPPLPAAGYLGGHGADDRLAMRPPAFADPHGGALSGLGGAFSPGANDPVYANMAPQQRAVPGHGLWGDEGSIGRGNAGALGGFDVEAQLAICGAGQRRQGNQSMHSYGQQRKGAGKANFAPASRHGGGPPGRFQ